MGAHSAANVLVVNNTATMLGSLASTGHMGITTTTFSCKQAEIYGKPRK
jgi:hypothetical protein